MALVKKEKEQTQQHINKFRYSCHGCTKDALFCEEARVGITIVCPHCGKEQVAKEENYIAL